MTEQQWKQVQVLNRTPLSQAVKPLVYQPSEDELYLTQALEQGINLLQGGAMPQTDLNLEQIAVLDETIQAATMNPEFYQEIMTSKDKDDPLGVPYQPEDIIARLTDKKLNWEEQLIALLEMTAENLLYNGLNLEPSLSFNR